MKVLVTGCSSAQTSESVAKKLPTFTSLFVQALRESGHDVVWDTPSIRWDEEYFKQYDTVVVGLTAPTSITAHRLYGALSVIDKAQKVTNVKYLIDAPEPYKLWNGIRALATNPEDLVKDFYSQRNEFRLASEPKNLSRLQKVIFDLYENTWNETIVPAFPWSTESDVTKHIPNLPSDRVILLCLDSLLFKNLKTDAVHMKGETVGWSYDQKTPWVNKISKTLSNSVSPMTSKDSSTLANINKSIGSLISVYKNNEPWWSANLAQSLYVHTPVVTDWQHSSFLGYSWSVLAQTVEDMSNSERVFLAKAQKESYLEVIDTYEDTMYKVPEIVFNN